MGARGLHLQPAALSDADRAKARVSNARRLRRKATPPEMVFWNLVRNRRLGGLKFRRQQPLGPYIADFYCADARLVVEIDGAVHDERTERDAQRDAWLREEGYLP